MFRQGSLWGITPQAAKKTLDFKLKTTDDGGTLVACSSRLASDWKNITVFGCVFAFVLVAVCVWIGTDLDAFMIGKNPSFWGWLITAYGIVNYGLGHALASLVWGLAVFLLVIIALEAVVGVYVHVKVERFAGQALSTI